MKSNITEERAVFDMGSLYAHLQGLKDSPKPRGMMDLREQVVMGDALHTQRAVSIQIAEAGGNYIWFAKGNQPQKAMPDAFSMPTSHRPLLSFLDFKKALNRRLFL